jgi:hypothetical protein
MKRTPLKARVQGRNKQQKDYARRHPNCEVCGRAGEHIHHIEHDRKNNTDENLFDLCFRHHTGDDGVHSMPEAKWIEKHNLCNHPKWKDRYEKLISKTQYQREIDNLFGK